MLLDLLMNALSPIRSHGTAVQNPSELAWPPTLPIELALRIATPPEIQQEYGYSDEEWAMLKEHPLFLKDLADACKMVREEGMSFKLKARLQADELLKTSWRLIHAAPDEVPSSVKADLIKATMRWAGYEEKPGVNQLANGTALNIQINL